MFRQEILQKYQVRKSKAQKAAFEAYLKDLLQQDGISLEPMIFGALKSRNLVVGDVTQAKAIFTAHYDTPAGMPIPNFITPCNFLIYLLYQIALTLVLFVIAGAAGAVFGILGFWPGYLAWLGTLGLLFGLMIFGPANKHTANDNTSGVLALIKLIKEMPKEVRDQCAFVFFDHEEAGLLGSSGLANKYKNELKNTPVINMDCVGEGKNVMFVYGKKACGDVIPLLEELKACGEYHVVLKTTGQAFYPSDQMNFKKGIGVATLKRVKVLGYYMDKIHTKKDTVCDMGNIDCLCSLMLQLAEGLTKQPQ